MLQWSQSNISFQVQPDEKVDATLTRNRSSTTTLHNVMGVIFFRQDGRRWKTIFGVEMQSFTLNFGQIDRKRHLFCHPSNPTIPPNSWWTPRWGAHPRIWRYRYDKEKRLVSHGSWISSPWKDHVLLVGPAWTIQVEWHFDPSSCQSSLFSLVSTFVVIVSLDII